MWWMVEYSLWNEEINDYETDTTTFDSWDKTRQFFCHQVSNPLCNFCEVTAYLGDTPNCEDPVVLRYRL